MRDPNTLNLTKTQSVMGVLVPLVATMFFFFSLQAGVEANLEKIEVNRASIEKLEARMESMSTTLQENHTNIKLIQLQMEHMTEKLEEMITALGEN